MSQLKSTRQTSRKSPMVMVAILAILVVSLVAIVYALGRKTSPTNDSINKVPASSPAVTAAPGQAINPSTGSSESPALTPAASTDTRPASSTLAAPTGQLLSSQSISLSKNEAEESVCQTVAGASCSIFVISPSGKIGSFEAPAVDGQGGHLVDWTPKKYTPSTGTWKIYAQATLNGQTSTSPTYTFEVTP